MPIVSLVGELTTHSGNHKTEDRLMKTNLDELRPNVEDNSVITKQESIKANQIITEQVNSAKLDLSTDIDDLLPPLPAASEDDDLDHALIPLSPIYTEETFSSDLESDSLDMLSEALDLHQSLYSDRLHSSPAKYPEFEPCKEVHYVTNLATNQLQSQPESPVRRLSLHLKRSISSVFRHRITQHVEEDPLEHSKVYKTSIFALESQGIRLSNPGISSIPQDQLDTSMAGTTQIFTLATNSDFENHICNAKKIPSNVSNLDESGIRKYTNALITQQTAEDLALGALEQKMLDSGWHSSEEIRDFHSKRELINQEWTAIITFYQEQL